LQIKPENRFWIYIYGFTAVVMLIAVSVFAWLAWTSKEEPGVGHVAGPHAANPATNSLPDEQYELLSKFQPPTYTPAPRAPQAFLSAMKLYREQDYAAAAAALRKAIETNPDFNPAKFYLGVSLLLAGDRIGGIQELRGLIEHEGPYLEPARFYLAKGLIAEHDIPRAQEQLENVVAWHGALEKQAETLLRQIRPSS
jgi:TolA-binding protein